MNGKKLKLWQKLGYGMGDFGSNYCWSFVASFVLLYFTNVLGVSATVIGTLMMFSKVLDGFTDVLAGGIIDKTHSKMGKARFWYFVSSFPTAICVYLIFNVPASFTENTKYVYIFIVYTLMGAVFYTMNNIAYSSLTALVTKDPKERVELGSYRFIFAILGVVLLQSTTSGLVERFGGGQQGWKMVSLLYTVICLVVLLIPVICVKELPEEELDNSTAAMETDKNKMGFKETIITLLKNKYFLVILFYYLGSYLFNGITGGLGVYYATYCIGNAGFLGAISFAGMLPIVFVLPFVPALTAKFGMRKTALIGAMISLAAMVIAYIAGLRGVTAVFLGGMVIRAIGNAPMTGGLNAFIAEADDYSELKFGKRMTGTIYSCSSVGLKIGTGIGTAACGILLDVIGFDGMAEVQSASTISALSNIYLLAWLFSAITLAVAVYFLDVEKENKKLRAALKSKEGK